MIRIYVSAIFIGLGVYILGGVHVLPEPAEQIGLTVVVASSVLLVLDLLWSKPW